MAVHNIYAQPLRGRYSPPPPESRRQEYVRDDFVRSGSGSGRSSHNLSSNPLAGFGDALKSFLPQWLDLSDAVLLLLFLFLYLESDDEEFLIILLVTGYGMFRKN